MGANGVAADVTRNGFGGPVKLFDAAECDRLALALEAERGKPPVWDKAAAVSSHAYYGVAIDKRVLALVTSVIGEDAILWGASLIVRAPGQRHALHSDVESCAADGGFVSVWIGLRNTQSRSGPAFLRGSHLFGVTAQEALVRRGLSRSDLSEQAMLELAHDLSPAAAIDRPELQDGDAVVFDGRVWHFSLNETCATRTALLLQYAAADRPVRIPKHYHWPVETREDERPPVLLVSGRATVGPNRIALAPDRGSGAVANDAYELAVPIAVTETPFATVPHFRGCTDKLEDLECHSSVLMPGASPHPLHMHAEEEILVVVAGEAELVTARTLGGEGLARTVMQPGDFAFYPAFQPHTLVNPSPAPVLYSMLKWKNGRKRPASGGSAALVKVGAVLSEVAVTDRRQGPVVLETASRWLERVHGHVSVLAPGSGYEAHADGYDVAIILLEGAVETLGRKMRAPAILYHPAGQLHGIRVVGAEPARYLVFELDGERRSTTPVHRIVRRLWRALCPHLSKGRRIAARHAPNWVRRVRRAMQRSEGMAPY